MCVCVCVSIYIYIYSLFILLRGVCCQAYYSGLTFLPPVDHVFSELITMPHPSWASLYGMAQSHSFIELHKPLHKGVIHEGFINVTLLKIYIVILLPLIISTEASKLGVLILFTGNFPFITGLSGHFCLGSYSL